MWRAWVSRVRDWNAVGVNYMKEKTVHTKQTIIQGQLKSSTFINLYVIKLQVIK